MEKMEEPANKQSWFGEGEIVDVDLLVDLLDTYRLGKSYVSAREIGFKAAATEPSQVSTTKMENQEDDNGSLENKIAPESTSSASSNSDPVVVDTIMSETGDNWLESNSTNLPTGDNWLESSDSDPVVVDTILNMSETGSNKEPDSNEEPGSNEEIGSNEETGDNLLESNSTNLPETEKETEQNAEDGEIEEEEEGVESERSSSLELDEKSNFEKLLTTQENYELYCPSCSSCITRKVILKKRKRGKHIDLSADLKSNVPVDEPDQSSDIEEMEPPVKVHVPEIRINDNEEIKLESDDDEDKDKGVIFTCLACLKYFIRLGTRFLQLDYISGKSVEEPEVVCDGTGSEVDETTTDYIDTMIPPSYPAMEIDQLDPTAENVAIKSPPQKKPDRERFAVELLKSTVYGGLTETITSLGVVSSASASGSSTLNILALAVANLAGGLVILAQNVQDLRNSSEKENDRYEELLGKRANFRMHVLVAVLSYILFGLIPPLVYAFSFYETEVKNYKLISVFSVSLICVVLLGMIKVYTRKPPNVRESPKSYFKSAAYYTSIVAASSGISYVVGDIVGEYIGKLGWFSLDQAGMTSPFDGSKLSEYRFTTF